MEITGSNKEDYSFYSENRSEINNAALNTDIEIKKKVTPKTLKLNINFKDNEQKIITEAFSQLKKYIQEKYSLKEQAELFKAYQVPNLSDINAFYGKSQQDFKKFELMVPNNRNSKKEEALNSFIEELINFKSNFNKGIVKSKLTNERKKSIIEELDNNFIDYIAFMNKMIKTYNPDLEPDFPDHSKNIQNSDLTDLLINIYSKANKSFDSEHKKDTYLSKIEQILINDVDNIKSDHWQLAQLTKAIKENNREKEDLAQLIIPPASRFDIEPEYKIGLSLSLNLNDKEDAFIKQNLNKYESKSYTSSKITENQLSDGDKFNFPELLTNQSGLYLTKENVTDIIKLVNNIKNSPSLKAIPSIKIGVDIDEAQSNYKSAIFYNSNHNDHSRIENNTLFDGLEPHLKYYPEKLKDWNDEDEYREPSVQAVFKDIPLKFNKDKVNIESRDLNISVNNIVKQSFLISSLLKVRTDQKFLARSINFNQMRSELPLEIDDLLSLISEPFSEKSQKLTAQIYKHIVKEQIDKGQNGVLNLSKANTINSTIDDLERTLSIPSPSPRLLKELVKNYAGDKKVELVQRIHKSNSKKFPIIDLDANEIQKLVYMSKNPILENRTRKIKNILDYSSNIEWNEFVKVLSIIDPKNLDDNELRNHLIKKLEPLNFEDFVKSISFLEDNISKDFFETILKTKVKDFFGGSDQLLGIFNEIKEIDFDGINEYATTFANEHNLDLFKSFTHKQPFKNLKQLFIPNKPFEDEIPAFLEDFLKEKGIENINYSFDEFKENFPPSMVDEFLSLLGTKYQGETQLNKGFDFFEKFEDYIKEISIDDIFELSKAKESLKRPFSLIPVSNFFVASNIEPGRYCPNEFGNKSAMIPMNKNTDTLYAIDKILEKPIKKFSLPHKSKKRRQVLKKIKELKPELQKRVVDSLRITNNNDMFDIQSLLNDDKEQVAKDTLLDKVQFTDSQNFKQIFNTEFSEEKRLSKIRVLLNSHTSRPISKQDQEKFKRNNNLEKYQAQGFIDNLGKNFLSYSYRVPFLDYLFKNANKFNQESKNFLVKIIADNPFLLKRLDQLNLDSNQYKNLINNLEEIPTHAISSILSGNNIGYSSKLSFLNKLYDLGMEVDYKLIPIKNISTDDNINFNEDLEELKNLPVNLRSKILSKTQFVNDEQLIQALKYKGFYPSDKENIASNVVIIRNPKNLGLAFDQDLDLSINGRVNLLNAAYKRHDKEDLIKLIQNIELDKNTKQIIKNFVMINGNLFNELKDFGFSEYEIDEVSEGIKKLSNHNFNLLFNENIPLRNRKNILKSIFKYASPEPHDLLENMNDFIKFSSEKAKKHEETFSKLGLKSIFTDLFLKGIIGYKYIDKIPFKEEELFKILDPEKNKDLKAEDFRLILQSDLPPTPFKLNLVNDILRSIKTEYIQLSNPSYNSGLSKFDKLNNKLRVLAESIISDPKLGKELFNKDKTLTEFLNKHPAGLNIRKFLAENINKNHSYLLEYLNFPQHDFPAHKYYNLNQLRSSN